ncbi:heme exporter protein CcmD [Sphingomonas solaris]|uniref:Heme exporter protein D n=1 Tax=Alterirhizorhabdus solaris TaxID=2529389 RepID=A0A558QU44_9SPHN|nr:heme exporter protein CcmD [Sphingomonas solaris]TVV70648.1 heme exporter protein CcmD [Sphingomonas solaris]
MNHWPFIAAAYAISIGGTVALTLWSLAAMRRAEKAADALKGRGPDRNRGRGE